MQQTPETNREPHERTHGYPRKDIREEYSYSIYLFTSGKKDSANCPDRPPEMRYGRVLRVECRLAIARARDYPGRSSVRSGSKQILRQRHSCIN